MELNIKLNFRSVDANLSPSMLKLFYIFGNYYFKNRSFASVKHLIVGKLADRDFLLTNIIATCKNTTLKLNDEQILEIYELLKHQDTISV